MADDANELALASTFKSFTSAPDGNCEHDRDHWIRNMTKLNDFDARTSMFGVTRRNIKITTLAEAVENMFNQIKLNYTAKCGGLEKTKLRRMIHCTRNHSLSTNW